MNLSERIKRVEDTILMNPELSRPEIENMPEEELNELTYRHLVDTIREIKQVCLNAYILARDKGSIVIKDRESFIDGLRFYSQHCIPEEPRKEFYSEDTINYWGNAFHKFRNRLIQDCIIKTGE